MGPVSLGHCVPATFSAWQPPANASVCGQRVAIPLAAAAVEAASTLMGLGRRQMYRLRRAFATDGPTAVVSRKRVYPSNHRRGETFRRTVLALMREHYSDFGPTLAAEKLAARHGLCVGVETLRQWMMADGLWKDRRHRLPSTHQPRRRRDGVGELVQIDGSEQVSHADVPAVQPRSPLPRQSRH
jgi:hypothetical protein